MKPPESASCIAACVVASYAGAWIETEINHILLVAEGCRSLRGSVDGNLLESIGIYAPEVVAPYAGAWIET